MVDEFRRRRAASFRIPLEQRPGMILSPALVIIGARLTRINCDRLVHGRHRTRCRTGNSWLVHDPLSVVVFLSKPG